MLLCIVYAVLFVDTVNMKIKAVVLLEWFRMKQTKMYVCTLEEFILVDIWIHWS